MCTVSWDATLKKDLLWFNRDEQRTRSIAEPPRMHRTPKGLNYLAPTDPDGGGTWIGINESGFIACLLNAYDLEAPSLPPTRSRGLVIRDLMEFTSVEDAFTRIEVAFRQDQIAPCRILLWPIHSKPGGVECSATGVQPIQLTRPMVTTSSFAPEKIHEWRQHAYDHLDSGPQKQEQFHALRHPEDPAFGVWMNREDAHTVSQTRILREPDQATMSYRTTPDAPWSKIAIPIQSL